MEPHDAQGHPTDTHYYEEQTRRFLQQQWSRMTLKISRNWETMIACTGSNIRHTIKWTRILAERRFPRPEARNSSLPARVRTGTRVRSCGVATQDRDDVCGRPLLPSRCMYAAAYSCAPLWHNGCILDSQVLLKFSPPISWG